MLVNDEAGHRQAAQIVVDSVAAPNVIRQVVGRTPVVKTHDTQQTATHFVPHPLAVEVIDHECADSTEAYFVASGVVDPVVVRSVPRRASIIPTSEEGGGKGGVP